MKPRNKTEREVVALSAKIPCISTAQEEWAKRKMIDIEDAYRRSSRITASAFLVITTYKGWQVIRYYMIYTKVAYHKIKKTWFVECFQHWLKNGKYVFLAKPRRMGYIYDAFIPYAGMTVKHDYCSFLGDPRDVCGWSGVYIAKVQDKYKYILRDRKDIDIDVLMRTVNASPFNETLLRKHPKVWEESRIKGFIYDAEKTAAIKIAIRYNYTITHEWYDMVDNLAYLGKDLHNPSLVCPSDIHQAHDKYMNAAQRKRKRISEKMTKLRQIAEERAELQHIEETARRNEEQRKEAQGLADLYERMRKRYFDIDMTDGLIHIQVLRSVEDFYEEGKAMCHCVFSNRYYDVKQKPNCLILSAKVNGERTETIEVDLLSFTVVQCRGKHNMDSHYHKQILNLINSNLWQIKQVNKRIASAG